MPVSRPGAVVTVALPRGSASAPPHAETSSPRRASARGPWIRTGKGLPSTVTRSLRQPVSTNAGAAGAGTPVIPTSTIDTGSVIGNSPGPGVVDARRVWSTTIRNRLPVTGANGRVTVCCVPALAASVRGGTVTERAGSPSTWIDSFVGTECRPSVTTERCNWSTVTGDAMFTSIQLPSWPPVPAVHAVDGSPSKAREARASASP